jgi:hypothetical protein
MLQLGEEGDAEDAQLLRIFSLLSVREVAKAACVNRHWCVRLRTAGQPTACMFALGSPAKLEHVCMCAPSGMEWPETLYSGSITFDATCSSLRQAMFLGEHVWLRAPRILGESLKIPKTSDRRARKQRVAAQPLSPSRSRFLST